MHKFYYFWIVLKKGFPPVLKLRQTLMRKCQGSLFIFGTMVLTYALIYQLDINIRKFLC